MKIIPISIGELDIQTKTERLKVVDKGSHIVLFTFSSGYKLIDTRYIIKGNLRHEEQICGRCGSPNIWKSGWRKNKFTTKQRWKCEECGYHYTEDATKLKYPLTIREFVKDNKDLSGRKISKMIKERFGLYVSHTTVTAIQNTAFPDRTRIVNQREMKNAT